jgi:hypothetical protein
MEMARESMCCAAGRCGYCEGDSDRLGAIRTDWDNTGCFGRLKKVLGKNISEKNTFGKKYIRENIGEIEKSFGKSFFWERFFGKRFWDDAGLWKYWEWSGMMRGYGNGAGKYVLRRRPMWVL